ncbi:MAG: metalloregulator ArsR/SmtB family transcription factor [Chitinophagales bacterium]|nr:metalloregulator ArsR/SmtB family transcription factor [Chitinophagales bacterium]
MGAVKTQGFTHQQLHMAKLAKALGHPARIAILEYLSKQVECVCGDIVDELPLAQATVLQHLKELKEVGLIKGEISGTKTCYCIDMQVWQEIQWMFADLFTKTIKNCC